MGQEQIIKHLSNLRLMGDNTFKTRKEIYAGLYPHNGGIHYNNFLRQLRILVSYAFVEVKYEKQKRGQPEKQTFRIKEEYIH